MRKLNLVLISFLITFTAFAQKNNEIGLTGGVSYYLGDVNHIVPFYSARPTFGILFRRNMAEHYALRANVQQIMIAGNDADFSNGYQQVRNYSFKNRMYEISTVFEFNFLPYAPANYLRFSPYVTGGVAIAFEQKTGNTVIPTLPFGMGFKYSPNKKFSISTEWVYRKTFTDKLDGLLPTEISENNINIKQVTDRNGTDWYSSLTIVLAYNITSDKVRCAAYPGITRRYK